jgi:hypothetical protein
MKKNMGSADKIIRLLIAVLLIVLYVLNVFPEIWGIVALVLALVFVVTSIIGFCPLYLPFGISTTACCKKKEK